MATVPPPNRPSGEGNRKWFQVFERIEPGDKFTVFEFDVPTAARDLKHRIVTGDCPIPEGDWEIHARSNQPEAGKSALYVRKNK